MGILNKIIYHKLEDKIFANVPAFIFSVSTFYQVTCILGKNNLCISVKYSLNIEPSFNTCLNCIYLYFKNVSYSYLNPQNLPDPTKYY